MKLHFTLYLCILITKVTRQSCSLRKLTIAYETLLYQSTSQGKPYLLNLFYSTLWLANDAFSNYRILLLASLYRFIVTVKCNAQYITWVHKLWVGLVLTNRRTKRTARITIGWPNFGYIRNITTCITAATKPILWTFS